ncbi:hypothetical protein [Spirosoma endbachense]|uniref:Uncharacterized protein n=1 Tax=Spirosoma endbachense TaxID=2666025 RepID=A0A6P1VYX8_9BACT|nr:hypothetical protein [Spirosoma endbachense]QHV96919.1 hypothetical protein GJR95_18740 [Spirosoma endbachense]
MLHHHRKIFFYVADWLNCWIGLREPNPLADQWIGKLGYIPKSAACKAKTSDTDASNFPFAGLVVDPILCPEGFQANTRNEAIDKWMKFALGNRLPPGFSRAETGPEKGLVKYEGSAIHSDYDLMYVSKADQTGNLAFTTLEEAKQLLKLAQPMLNQRLGAAMIQHGAEFEWDGGVGARERELVFRFGPKGKYYEEESSMPQRKGFMH